MSAVDELEEILGPASGKTRDQRVATSTTRFVRSQLQLARFRGETKGRILTAVEAYDVFGWDAIVKVAQEGSFPLAASHDEPAATLKKRRIELGMSVDRLAKQARVLPGDILNAEQAGTVLQIHKLERIAQAMALDERVIGHIKGARGDTPLGVRLREVAQQQDASRFSDRDVLQLAEAAWVVARQVSLDEALNGTRRLLDSFKPSSDYRYKAYDRGEELAQSTRAILNLDPITPILSLKSLAEEELRIPVTQQELSEQFAGATVANGSARGVVLNERGMNENVWVRRMTLAHELGHLLWDPDNHLNRLKVHRYEDVQTSGRLRDPVEIRANAFGVNFLAPREGVRTIMASAASDVAGVTKVMAFYGISATAAKYHVFNMTHIDIDASARDLGVADDEWIARENMALDIFKPQATPLSRRGKFAWHVINSYRQGLISEDTAATFLCCSTNEVKENAEFIFQALSPEKTTRA